MALWHDGYGLLAPRLAVPPRDMCNRLVLGAGVDMQAKLKLDTGSNYLSNETDHRGTDPARAFTEVVDAMTSIGFDAQVH